MSEIKTNKISSLTSSNSDITLDPDGTGDVIVASGNVGIGTASPNNNSGRTTLTINNASQGGAIDLEHNGTVVGKFICDGENTLGIQADGNKDILFKTNGSSRMLLSGSGRALIGTTSTIAGATSLVFSGTEPAASFNISDATTSYKTVANICANGSANGAIQTNTLNQTRYTTSSDYRLKENVTDMTGAIDRVKALAPKQFSFISDPDSTLIDGFLAHEAQAVVPEAVSGTHNEVDDDGNPVMQGIDQSKLVPLLTGALREAIAKIEALEARVTALENA